MKNRDPKNLSLPLSSINLPATVSGINRNSPSRASIKIVLPPVIPSSPAKDASILCSQPNSAPPPAPHKVQGSSRHLSSLEQPCYDANNYYSIKPSMQQIPEQSTISMFVEDPTASDVERTSPGSLADQLKYNRYSSTSLDSGRGSDSVKLTSSGQSNRVSVHSCESIGSTSSNKDSESSQQSSLSSSSSTSSSFCSSSSSSSSSYPNQYSNRTLSSSSSIVSNSDSATPIGDFTVHSSNVFTASKGSGGGGGYANMMPITRRVSATSEMSGNIQNLVAQAGPPSIAEMILHGISDSEIIHNWLQKIKMGKYEKNFIDAAYDMSTIARMTPQDLSAIGITDPKARSVFTSEIQKLNVPEGIPQYKPDSLSEWLKLLNLDCYYPSLCQQGFTTIDRVTELDLEDFEDVGIFKLGHQKKLMLAQKMVKSLKSKQQQQQQQTTLASDGQEIYSASQLARGNPIAPPQENQHPVAPTIMPSHHHMGQHPHHPNGQPLPYQDVPIKMYASIKQQNSPTQPERPPFDACSIITPSNIVPSALFNAKPQMRTFQQMSDMSRMNFPPPNVNISYGVPPSSAYPQFVSVPLSARGRSLESLDNNNPELQYYNTNYQYANQNVDYSNMTPYRPHYQLSNGELNSINRQTVCYEANNPAMNSFIMNPSQFGNNQMNYEIDGTATLNRPKNLIKSKPVAKIMASSRQSDLYDGYDTTSIQSNDGDSQDKISIISDCSSETSSIYSSVKKKPPPPPKRVNSIKKPSSGHQPDHTSQGAFSEQVYSNLMYLNSSHLYSDRLDSSLTNENVFASCVKSLTTKFSEMHSLASTDDDPSNSTAKQQKTPPMHSTHTLPMNKKEMNFIESNSIDMVNVSSSSSTESMPFANDNVGTIRQKSSNFLQNALKLSDTKLSSSSSSSSSTSSPMFAKNVSLPNSTLNSPMSTAVSNFHSNAFASQPIEDKTHQINSNDSRQNVVDSLEDIEIMLANLKTQLDSI